ncbi:hypothetical protein PTKIN_Ptkin08bG0112300 [Pterospermum kingtungense]
MDRSWMQNMRWSEEYREGVERFLDFAFENASEDGRILCPCLRCANIDWKMCEIATEHLICIGFLPSYKNWHYHGEFVPSNRLPSRDSPTFPRTQDDIEGLL